MLRMEVYSYFRRNGYYRGPWVSFVMTKKFSLMVTKITSRMVSRELVIYISDFTSLLT